MCCTGHKFYYAKDMDVDEAWVFKCYDSRRNCARFTPHAAFVDPSSPADAPPRESVEIRSFAFWEQETPQDVALDL